MTYSPDPVINDVITQVITRSEEGLAKFGKTMEQADGDTLHWLENAIEEALDCAVYLVKMKRVLLGRTQWSPLPDVVAPCTCAGCMRKVYNKA